MDNNTATMIEKVQEAIHSDKNELNYIVLTLRSDTLDEESFYNCISTLKNSVHSISKEHELLIGVVLSTEWSVYSDNCIHLFLEFVTDLVSSKSYYLKVCIRSLIKGFVLKKEVEGDELIKLHKKFDYIHHCLQAILVIAPLAAKFITDAVVSFFPYIGKSVFILETYIVNTLQMITYVQGCRYQILALLIDKLLSIDVRIPRQKLEEETEESDDLLFVVDDTDNETKIARLQDTEKLDELMNILFTYTKAICFINGVLQLKKAESLFDDLLRIYDDVILRTQQSSHVQFVLFYVASFDKKLYGKYVEVCWKVFETPGNAQVIRQASSSFLASFLARANYIDKEFLSDQLKLMSDWLHRYLKLQDNESVSPDARKHASFYCVCQTLFYTIVYHHQYYVESKKGIAFLKTLELQRIVLSRLNPLRFCLNSIVCVFARITRMYEIVFCYSIIERNNRNIANQLVQEETDSKSFETFFPFDPYMLTKSGQLLKPLYLDWQGSHLEDESDDGGIANMEDVEDLFKSIENNLATDDPIMHYKNKSKYSTSFDMMCISPGFGLAHQ